MLDKSTVYVKGRWIGFGVAMLLYLLRVYFVNGWYIVTYGLGIYLLNLFIGFLSPQVRRYCRTLQCARTPAVIEDSRGGWVGGAMRGGGR